MKFTMLRNLTFAGAAAAGFFFASNAQSESLEVTQQEKMVTQYVSRIMSDFHYAKKPLNDDLSEHIYDQFFRTLDPQRRIFLKTDIDEFSKYRKLLDDMYSVGDLSFADRVFDRFRKRLQQRADNVAEALKQKPDVSDEEKMVIDREKAPWAESAEELDKGT